MTDNPRDKLADEKSLALSGEAFLSLLYSLFIEKNTWINVFLKPKHYLNFKP